MFIGVIEYESGDTALILSNDKDQNHAARALENAADKLGARLVDCFAPTYLQGVFLLKEVEV